MKYLPVIAGILLGLLFIMSSSVVLFGLVPTPEIPAGTPVAHFMSAFGPTGYMTFVKIFEMLGGILVAIPRTRNLGLLILGPIIVNILAFHLLVAGDGVFSPMLIGICLLALFLIWSDRKRWLGFVFRTATAET
jgi:putative oxidoreductase